MQYKYKKCIGIIHINFKRKKKISGQKERGKKYTPNFPLPSKNKLQNIFDKKTKTKTKTFSLSYNTSPPSKLMKRNFLFSLPLGLCILS